MVGGQEKAESAPSFWARSYSGLRTGFVGLSLALVCFPTSASGKVRITGLSDVNFGALSNLNVDAVQAQSVCVYSNGTGSRYSVRADGSGAGGSFTLSNGFAAMAYDVRWRDMPGQSNGTTLNPGQSLGGQVANANNQFCSPGPPTSASLIVTLPAASLNSAQAGSYAGTLTLIIAEE